MGDRKVREQTFDRRDESWDNLILQLRLLWLSSKSTNQRYLLLVLPSKSWSALDRRFLSWQGIKVLLLQPIWFSDSKGLQPLTARG